MRSSIKASPPALSEGEGSQQGHIALRASIEKKTWWLGVLYGAGVILLPNKEAEVHFTCVGRGGGREWVQDSFTDKTQDAVGLFSQKTKVDYGFIVEQNPQENTRKILGRSNE